MIRTAKDLGPTFRLGHHGGGMVAADIEESAQNAIIGSHDENRITRQIARDVLTRLANLSGAPHYLPGARENRAAFQFKDARVNVP
jgi:hypothetical protein